MKKYKLSEAIAMLEENENLKFRAHDGIILFYDLGVKTVFEKSNYEVNKLYMRREYTLIQEPVSFMEVIKSNKLIRVEHDYIQNIAEDADTQDSELLSRMMTGVFIEFDDLMFVLSNNSNASELRNIIYEGKWYIEED